MSGYAHGLSFFFAMVFNAYVLPVVLCRTSTTLPCAPDPRTTHWMRSSGDTAGSVG